MPEFPPGLSAAAHALGGIVRGALGTYYILVELGQGEHASVLFTGTEWKVFWPWGDTDRCNFTCANIEAVKHVLADLCTTPRPSFRKGD